MPAQTSDGDPSAIGTPATVYLDCGHRDGVRPGDVVRLIEEVGALDRAEVGPIRIRDRCTFVDVPGARIEALIERLRGQTLCERTLSPERARTSRG